MRKIIIALIVLTFILPIMPVFAQNNTGGLADIYYINVRIERIFPSYLGYVIQYRKGDNKVGTIGVPNDWLSESAGRAEILRLPVASDWPSMSVFFKDGEFSHVRLYVHRVKGHRTWGVLPARVDLEKIFEDMESFNIVF